MLMSRIATAVEKEIGHTLVPIIGIIAIVPLVGALLSFRLAQWIVRPIAGLAEIADKVTMGDLETSVGGECLIARDEIGDLARSLERMRSSLRAAMLRLRSPLAQIIDVLYPSPVFLHQRQSIVMQSRKFSKAHHSSPPNSCYQHSSAVER